MLSILFASFANLITNGSNYPAWVAELGKTENQGSVTWRIQRFSFPNGFSSRMAPLVHLRRSFSYWRGSLMDSRRCYLPIVGYHDRWRLWLSLVPSERAARRQRNRTSRADRIRATSVLFPARRLRRNVLSNVYLKSRRSASRGRVSSHINSNETDLPNTESSISKFWNFIQMAITSAFRFSGFIRLGLIDILSNEKKTNFRFIYNVHEEKWRRKTIIVHVITEFEVLCP